MVPVQIYGQECISNAYVRDPYRDAEDNGLQFAALVHLIGGLMIVGYAQQYYFHLRKYLR